MSDLDRNYASPFGRAAGRIDAAAVDAGLRAYMLRIYNYMSIGLAITGLAALGVYMGAVTTDQSAAVAKFGNAYLTQFGYAMFVSPLKWLFILAPLAMVFVISAGINRLQPATAQLLFWVFSALMGLSLSSIFLVYTHTSIVRVFFITAATFGALSLYGYTTKRDMSGMGSFLFMGLIGIIIASLVNLFLASSALQFIVSVVGVFVFANMRSTAARSGRCAARTAETASSMRRRRWSRGAVGGVPVTSTWTSAARRRASTSTTAIPQRVSPGSTPRIRTTSAGRRARPGYGGRGGVKSPAGATTLHVSPVIGAELPAPSRASLPATARSTSPWPRSAAPSAPGCSPGRPPARSSRRARRPLRAHLQQVAAVSRGPRVRGARAQLGAQQPSRRHAAAGHGAFHRIQ